MGHYWSDIATPEELEYAELRLKIMRIAGTVIVGTLTIEELEILQECRNGDFVKDAIELLKKLGKWD